MDVGPATSVQLKKQRVCFLNLLHPGSQIYFRLFIPVRPGLTREGTRKYQSVCMILQVYWCNGAQISAPHDKEILRSIEEHLEPWNATCWDEKLLETTSLRTDPLTQINSCYMDELASLCYHR